MNNHKRGNHDREQCSDSLAKSRDIDNKTIYILAREVRGESIQNQSKRLE